MALPDAVALAYYLLHFSLKWVTSPTPAGLGSHREVTQLIDSVLGVSTCTQLPDSPSQESNTLAVSTGPEVRKTVRNSENELPSLLFAS